MEKKAREIVFYYPGKLPVNQNSGEAIRPLRMISAFEKIGLKVHTITGDVSQRKTIIHSLKKNIVANKIKPSFVYIESTNLPLPLSSPGQKIPNFFLDINFLRWLKKRRFIIGLFYRDIYWKFNAWWKRQGLLRGSLISPLYYYELYQYLNVVDLVFCPSAQFGEIISKFEKQTRYFILPPGSDVYNEMPLPKFHNILNLLYVGCCRPPIYDLSVVLLACKKLNMRVSLTICTRRDEWIKAKRFYKDYIGTNVRIAHESGIALKKRYLSSHVSILPINKNEYRALVMPLKLFEAIGYYRPIIAAANSAEGRFVKENGIGWVTNENVNGLTKILETLIHQFSLIDNAVQNIKKIKPDHTWQARAKSILNAMEYYSIMNHQEGGKLL